MSEGVIDVKEFPRATRAESLAKILSYAKKQKFYPGFYISQDGRCRCAVGVLLPIKAIKAIKGEGKNGYGVDDVAESVFGTKSALTRLTGMSQAELRRIQSMNDNEQRKDLLDYCKRELVKIERRNAKKAVLA